MRSRTTHVVLDCDPGHDDAFAILLAAAHPKLTLHAITTVSGNGSLERVTDNARRICTLARIDVPIAAGADAPLRGLASAAPSIHGASGLDGPALPEPDVPIVVQSAIELMAELIEQGNDPITIIATGPLTNVAQLLQRYPAVHGRIERISFMGGSTGRGNWTPAAEFNIWADPEAANIVVGSGLPLTMSGLNITHQAVATPDVLRRFGGLGTPLGEVCAAWLDYFAGTYRDVFGMPHPPLHDPVAVAVVAEPGIATTQASNVAIETSGELTRGATVVDLDGITERPLNADIAIDLDVGRYWDVLVDAVGRLGGTAEGVDS